MLTRLIYISDVAEIFEFSDLQSILDKAQKNNPTLDVTGFLVMASKRFLQVIEGPAENVNLLFRKIVRDSRHTECRLIEYSEIAGRLFDQWAMRGIHPDLMDRRLKAFLQRKYGTDQRGGLAVPEDRFSATSFLYDVAHVDAIVEEPA
jgi:hypothetical protein